jgi:hypothetical protein
MGLAAQVVSQFSIGIRQVLILAYKASKLPDKLVIERLPVRICKLAGRRLGR